MLGAYEDSDEEDAAVSRSTTTSQHNHSADIDSTLANFMAVSIIIICSWVGLLKLNLTFITKV